MLRSDVASPADGTPTPPLPDLDQILQAASMADDGSAPDWLYEARQPIKSFLEEQRDQAGSAMVADFRLISRAADPNPKAQRAALSTLAEVMETCLADTDRIEHGGPSGLMVLFSSASSGAAEHTTSQILRRAGQELRKAREASVFTARGLCFDYAPYLDEDGMCTLESLRGRAEQIIAGRIARHRQENSGGDESHLILQFAPIIVPRKRMMVGYATQGIERVMLSARSAGARPDKGNANLTVNTLSALSEVLTRRDDQPNVLLTLNLAPELLAHATSREAFEAALFELPDHARRRLFLNVDLTRAAATETEIPYVTEILSGRGRGVFLTVPLDFGNFDLAAQAGCQAICPVLPRDYSDSAKDRAALRKFTEKCRNSGLKSAWFPRGGKQLSGRAILSSTFDMFSFPSLLPPAKEPNPVYRMPRRSGSGSDTPVLLTPGNGRRRLGGNR